MPDPDDVADAFGEESPDIEDDSLGQGCDDEPEPEDET